MDAKLSRQFREVAQSTSLDPEEIVRECLRLALPVLKAHAVMRKAESFPPGSLKRFITPARNREEKLILQAGSLAVDHD
jgi:hypothetical protein